MSTQMQNEREPVRFLDRAYDQIDHAMTFAEKVKAREPAVRSRSKPNTGAIKAPGGEHLEHVQEIAGKQRWVRFFYVLIHIVVFVGLAGKAIHGVVEYGQNVPINLLAAIVADLSFLGIVMAMKAQELLGSDMATAKTLYRVSIIDIILGATVSGLSALFALPQIRTGYYEVGMIVFLAWQLHLWIKIVAFGQAATAVREGMDLILNRSMANLRHSYVQTQAYIAQQQAKIQRAENSRRVMTRADSLFNAEATDAVTAAESGIKRAARAHVHAALKRSRMWLPRRSFIDMLKRRPFELPAYSGDGGDGARANPLPDLNDQAKDQVIEIKPGGRTPGKAKGRA